MRECLEAIQAHPIWIGRDLTTASGRGVGIAVGGWPGGIEPATAVCRLDADGRLTVVVGSVDLSGTNTGFAQIAGDNAPDPLVDLFDPLLRANAQPRTGEQAEEKARQQA